MEEAGVVTQNVAVLDPIAVNVFVTAIVEVDLIDDRAETVDAAKAQFADTPEV